MQNTLRIVAALALGASATLGAGADKSREVLAEARKALGGQDRVDAVRTILATGKSQRQMGQMQVGGDIELAIALPDRYVRTQIDNMMGAQVTREQGFNAGDLIERSAAPPGARIMFRSGGDDGGDPERGRQTRLQAQKNELARLLVAWLASAPAYARAEFTYIGEAESPDGRADAMEVKGADGLALKLFIDKKTRRPLMVTYQGRPPVIRTHTMTQGSQRPAEGALAAETPPLTEIQWFVDDFRQVGDLWLPHRLVQAAQGNTIEEWEFSKIVVNQPIKDDKFKR
jgi:hypothetical protein